jgi:hypothetical protein
MFWQTARQMLISCRAKGLEKTPSKELLGHRLGCRLRLKGKPAEAVWLGAGKDVTSEGAWRLGKRPSVEISLKYHHPRFVYLPCLTYSSVQQAYIEYHLNAGMTKSLGGDLAGLVGQHRSPS